MPFRRNLEGLFYYPSSPIGERRVIDEGLSLIAEENFIAVDKS